MAVPRHEAQQAYQTAIKESRCAALAQHGFSVAENGMDLQLWQHLAAPCS